MNTVNKTQFPGLNDKRFYFRDGIIFFYKNYIIHCKIKKDNHQVPKIIRVPGNKTNPKKRIVATTINTEYTDLRLV